jgi:hypothetical protein
MEFALATPLTIGDLQHQITIDKLEIASVSLNFEPMYSDKGVAVLSVVLVHRPSGHKVNIVYEDASALTFWQTHEAGLATAIFEKLIADGKLPAGSLA